METSSPLAAIRPSAPAFGQRGLFQPHAFPHLSSNPFGAGTLNLRDQFSFQRQQPVDYINVKSFQGSSPSGTLAADLSQNFNIADSSPLFPTPRRALFTTATMTDANETREYITTPPLLVPSSPVPTIEMMDASPLPHKVPQISQIELCASSPARSPRAGSVLASPAPRQTALEPPKPVFAERRIAGLRRQSLTRHKCHSTGSVNTNRSQTDSPLPPFRFGGDSWLGRPSSALSLSECFQDSPPQERRPQSANSPCAAAAAGPRPKPHFSGLGGAGHFRNGSPISGHARRHPHANHLARPRKLSRRSLSMFESPDDVMKTKQDDAPQTPTLQAVMDVEEPPEPVLPHFFAEGQSDSIPRISQSTMLDVLDGKYCDRFDQKMVVDCRFEYEYEGGHIDTAINYNDKELLARQLFGTPMQGRTLLIFHCEYSAHRAPIMARHIRAEDRSANAESYPKLTYPDVYILDGGYSGFFNAHRDRCYPQAYVEMGDAQHVNTCEREMGRLRQNRKGLCRAQTFAFGQQGGGVEDSPTAPGRSNGRSSSRGSYDMMIGASPILGNDRCHTRRMASY